MLLDEPTTGQDAKTALDIMLTLKLLSKKSTFAQKAVVVVIHQPRASIFALLDDVLILGVGANRVGRVVDSGPAAEVGQRAVAAWREAGNTLENAHDVANTILDVVASLSPEEVEARATRHHRLSEIEKTKREEIQSPAEDFATSGMASARDRYLATATRSAWVSQAGGFDVLGSTVYTIVFVAAIFTAFPNVYFAVGPELPELLTQTTGCFFLITCIPGILFMYSQGMSFRAMRWLRRGEVLTGGEEAARVCLELATVTLLSACCALAGTSITLHPYLTVSRQRATA